MSNTIRQKAILVLGMHRSGTSVVTAGLQALGIQLGQGTHAANRENPKGFFENRDVMELNDQILKTLGYSWNNPFVNGIDLQGHNLDHFFANAVSTLRKHYMDSDLWALKDPRLCLLLPFWQRVISQKGCDIFYVHVLRNPLEVASSLQVRGDIFSHYLCGDMTQSFLLWFSYHFQALSSVNCNNNIMINFDDFIDDPRHQLDRLATFLDISANQEDVRRYTDCFVEKDLKHHTESIDKLRSSSSSFTFIADFYKNLLTLKKDSSFGYSSIQNILAKTPNLRLFQVCSKVAAPVFENASNTHSLRQSNVFLEEELKKISSRLVLLEEELLAKTMAYDALDKQHYRLTNTLTWRIITKGKTIIKRIHGLVFNVRKLRSSAASYRIKRTKVAAYFDPRWYLDEYPDILDSGMGPWLHYEKHGNEEGRDPNPYFDTGWYRSEYPEVDSTGMDPLLHYIKYGVAKDLNPNPYFDAAWYRNKYPEVDSTGMDPLIHYIKCGAADGKNPNPTFDVTWYLSFHSDIDRLGIEPLLHYIHYGLAERRKTSLAVNPDQHRQKG